MKIYDLCILTSANEIQAEGYRQQLSWRRERKLLPAGTDFLVFSDPLGRRVGSGGSTIYALVKLMERDGGDFEKAFGGKRILILHSGGDSRRLPAYSALGKIFTPLPTASYYTLFDIMLHNYARLPVVEKGQVVITSGDVLLNFEAEYVRFHDKGMTGVAYPDDPKAAAGYGVYVVRDGNAHDNPRPVDDFLQKPDPEALEAAGAIDLGNRTWIDTGIINLTTDAVKKMVGCHDLIKAVEAAQVNYNLYHEIVFAIMGKSKIADSDRLRQIDLTVSLLPYCGFFHIGKSEELVRNFYTLTHASALYQFANGTRSNTMSYPHLKDTYIYNCLVQTGNIQSEAPVLVEGSIVNRALTLRGDNILTGLPRGVGPIKLPRGQCLSMLPLNDGRWAAIVYGIRDSFKDHESSFLNADFDNWHQNRSLVAKDIWPEGKEGSLWCARLFPAHRDPKRSAALAQSLLNDKSNLKKWLACDRLSMEEILRHTDHRRMLNQMWDIERKVRLLTFEQTFSADSLEGYRDLMAVCQTSGERRQLVANLRQVAERTLNLTFKARIQYLIGQILEEMKGAQVGGDKEMKADIWLDRAFATIRAAVARGLEKRQCKEHKGLRIRSDEVVWICVPARLDFAGGWTDTPPHCLDQGGCVLNAAVTLNGQYPIQVIGKIYKKPVIRINSIDLGASVEIDNIMQLRDFTDPGDWLALPKSAFFAAGIFSDQERGALGTILRKFGGGIDLTLFSALPAGSGLGTSSILGAGIITCISRMFEMPITPDELFTRTLIMEQLMTTGGGWQDQIGGAVGGVKLIRTEPGFRQNPATAWTRLTGPGMQASERMLLYYTGYRRIAKNILRQIVGRYLNRDPEALNTLKRLSNIAAEMHDDLDQRDIDAFGDKIAQVWELNKILDAGSTTPDIEKILGHISKYICGAKLLGAGGGGFLFIVCRSSEDARAVRRILESDPPNDRARFFDFDVDEGGLKVSVL